MPSRSDLEQDVAILEAENGDLKRQLFEAQRDLDIARGATKIVVDQAEQAGVELAIPNTPAEAERQELVAMRKHVEDDLQALLELRNPLAPPATQESALDIVRANQAERRELNERLAAANLIINRVAAILSIQQWDAEGTELREACQRLVHLRFSAQRKRGEVEREIKPTAKHDRAAAAELTGWLHACDWFLELMYNVGPTKRTPVTAPDDALRCEQDGGLETIVRPTQNGMFEILVCKGALIVNRFLISDLQIAMAKDPDPVKDPHVGGHLGPYR